MKTRDEMWTEFDRLMEEDRFDDANALLDTIPPLGDEEWRRRLAEAPIAEEGVPEEILREVERVTAAIRRADAARAGWGGRSSGISRPWSRSTN